MITRESRSDAFRCAMRDDDKIVGRNQIFGAALWQFSLDVFER
jgi:hypothetical protein